MEVTGKFIYDSDTEVIRFELDEKCQEWFGKVASFKIQPEYNPEVMVPGLEGFHLREIPAIDLVVGNQGCHKGKVGAVFDCTPKAELEAFVDYVSDCEPCELCNSGRPKEHGWQQKCKPPIELASK